MKNTAIGKSIQYLALCFVTAALLCFAQVSGSEVMILGVLVLQLVLTVAAAFGSMASPVLLFFLPWSTVIKLSPGNTSFYTIGLMGVCLVYMIRRGLQLNRRCLAAAIGLMAVTLVGKLLSDEWLSMSYVMFFFLLILFPQVMREISAGVNFRLLTVFFSLGIIGAAVSARMLLNFSNIARYIDVDSWTNVVRYSGYYGDPNFYSAHISAALGGVLMIIASEKQMKRFVLWLLLAAVLLYCGLMSASKAFVLSAMIMLLLWVILIMVRRGGTVIKLGVLLGVLAVSVIIVRTHAFEEVIQVISHRFSVGTGLSDLTTGRADLWQNYTETLLESPDLLFLGAGYSNVKLGGRAPHNTLIQMVFQFGLIGLPLILYWMNAYLTGALRGCRVRLLSVSVLLIGVFMPWLALDMLFFDEFFLMPLYVAAAGVHLHDANSKSGAPKGNAAAGTGQTGPNTPDSV